MEKTTFTIKLFLFCIISMLVYPVMTILEVIWSMIGIVLDFIYTAWDNYEEFTFR